MINNTSKILNQNNEIINLTKTLIKLLVTLEFLKNKYFLLTNIKLNFYQIISQLSYVQTKKKSDNNKKRKEMLAR
jgi:hypothetical protein